MVYYLLDLLPQINYPRHSLPDLPRSFVISLLKSPQISLKENPDILSDISKSKNRPELVIGFAAETDDLIKNAKSKLNQKGCDIIVANKIDNKSSVFGNLENKVSIISNDKTVHWPKMSKAEIGEKLSDLIENH